MNKIIMARSFLYLKSKVIITVLVVVLSSMLGLTLGISVCYFSAQELYMEGINHSFPATIWFMSKSGEGDVITAINMHDFVVNDLDINLVESFENEQYIKLTLKSHNTVDAVVERLNKKYTNTFGNNTDFVFANTTEYSSKQLVKSIEISSKYQTSIVIAFLCCTIAGFTVLYINSVKAFGKDVYILKRIGETNKNITWQFRFQQIITVTIPIFLFAGIALAFSGVISDLWLKSATADFKEGSSIMVFNNEKALLELLSNNNLFVYSMVLAFTVILINIAVLTLGSLYYKKR